MKKNKKGYTQNLLICSIFSLLCGIFVGLIIFGFKYAAKYIEEGSRHLYKVTSDSFVLILLSFIVLIIMSFLMYLLHIKVPESKGGGIPRSEGVLRGILPLKAIRTFFGTIIGSFISYFAGLPLGTEGPSVIIGTSIGDMTSKTNIKAQVQERYIKTGGAAAGFAVATGAPLSGVFFALEEIHKRFTPMLVLSVSLSVLSATIINNSLCEIVGISPSLFELNIFTEFKLKHIYYLILLAIIIGVIVGIFDKVLELVNKFTSKHIKVFHPLTKLAFVFIITGVLGYVFIDGIYSGHHTVLDMLDPTNPVFYLTILLVVRFIMMILLTDSSATGGIFIPVLAIASVVGALLSKLLVTLGLSNIYYEAIVILSMCAFLGGTLRAPFTAIILFIELTQSYTNILYIVTVVFIVNLITELFNNPSFYDRRLEKMEHEEYHDKKPIISHFEAVISKNSFVVGKAVRDIMWPYSSVVISIKGKEHSIDMDNDGEKILYALDTIVIRCKYYNEEELLHLLKNLVGKDYEIKKINI